MPVRIQETRQIILYPTDYDALCALVSEPLETDDPLARAKRCYAPLDIAR